MVDDDVDLLRTFAALQSTTSEARGEREKKGPEEEVTDGMDKRGPHHWMIARIDN